MSKFDSYIRSYKIELPIGGVYRWGAKGVISYVGEGKSVETKEFWGKNKKGATLRPAPTLDHTHSPTLSITPQASRTSPSAKTLKSP